MNRHDAVGELIEGSPRSVFETEFVAGMRPCKDCGAYTERWSTWRVEKSMWRTDSLCSGCGKPRAFHFLRSDLDLPSIQPDVYELGGPEHSTVMTADELAREIDRLRPLVVAPKTVPAAAQDDAWARLMRLQIAVNELAKFLEAGTITKYDRQWVTQERARLAALED